MKIPKHAILNENTPQKSIFKNLGKMGEGYRGHRSPGFLRLNYKIYLNIFLPQQLSHIDF